MKFNVLAAAITGAIAVAGSIGFIGVIDMYSEGFGEMYSEGFGRPILEINLN